MPGIDGVTLSHKLKSDTKTKHIPIIISTAKNLSDDEHRALKEIVEEITIKSKNHPLDVLKIVRDRIKMHEVDRNYFINAEEPVVEDNINIFDDPQLSEHSADILIVDDDADTLFTMNEIVQAAGYKTHLAKSGFECLKTLEYLKPDLILLDIMMPEMDGFQTLKIIRNNSSLKEIPVFAVTAKAMVGDKEIILKHGFDDYIPKPVNSAIITGKLSQTLSKIKSNNV